MLSGCFADLGFATAPQTTRLRDHETTRLQVAAALGFANASQTTRPQDYETTSRQVATALLQ